MKFDKKFIQPIIAGVSLISLFIFPFVNNDYGYNVGNSFNGFTVAMNTYIGYLMILLPLVLVVAPFIPKYQAKLPLLSLATPVICIVSWLLCVLFAKTFVANLANSTLAIGAYLSLICYIALAIYGFTTYRSVLSQLVSEFKRKQK